MCCIELFKKQLEISLLRQSLEICFFHGGLLLNHALKLVCLPRTLLYLFPAQNAALHTAEPFLELDIAVVDLGRDDSPSDTFESAFSFGMIFVFLK